MRLPFNDSDQQMGGHGARYLRHHRVFAGSKKVPDAQVLLDPFEDQLHLPAALIQRAHGQWGQRGIVGQKHPCPVRLGIFESEAPQMLGKVIGDVNAVELNGQDNSARGSVDPGRVHAAGVHAAFGSRRRGRSRLMQIEESAEVRTTPVHHVKSRRLYWQDIELQARRTLDVEPAVSHDQAHCPSVINSPVPLIQSVRERGSGGPTAQAQVQPLSIVLKSHRYWPYSRYASIKPNPIGLQTR